jgi:hypothetical protein
MKINIPRDLDATKTGKAYTLFAKDGNLYANYCRWSPHLVKAAIVEDGADLDGLLAEGNYIGEVFIVPAVSVDLE